jgi:hypothetical protein
MQHSNPPFDPLLKRISKKAEAVPMSALSGLSLSSADHTLIAAAHDVLARHYKPFWHTVAAAIRGQDGRIWTGLHLGATVGRLSICAEAVALGRALLEGDGRIEAVVAVRHPKPDEADRTLAVSRCAGDSPWPGRVGKSAGKATVAATIPAIAPSGRAAPG